MQIVRHEVIGELRPGKGEHWAASALRTIADDVTHQSRGGRSRQLTYAATWEDGTELSVNVEPPETAAAVAEL